MEKVKTAKKLGQVDLEESGRQFKCVVCDGNFKNMELMKHHIVTHFSRELTKLVCHKKPFTCPECGKQSLNKANLIKHLCWVHSKFEEVTGLSEEAIHPCQLYRPVSTVLQHVTDEFEDEYMSLETGKEKEEHISSINIQEEITVQEKKDDKDRHGKCQRKLHTKVDKENKVNTKVSNNQPEIVQMPSNVKEVEHIVKVTQKELTDKTENSVTIKEQTEAVVNNQYLGLCHICQAILLSEVSFKNHMKEHEEKIGQCSSTVNPTSSKPSGDVGEKAHKQETKPPKNVNVKCSYCRNVFVDQCQLQRHWFKRKYCCLQYSAISEPVMDL